MKLIIRSNHYYIQYRNHLKGYSEAKATGIEIHERQAKARANKALQKFMIDYYANRLGGTFSKPIHGNLDLNPNIYILDAYERYKAHLEIKNPDTGNKTKSGYNKAVEDFVAACGNKPLFAYTNLDYDRLLDFWAKGINADGTPRKRPLGHNSKAAYMRYLNAMFNWFEHKKIIQENFLERIKKQETEPDPIKMPMLKKFLEFLKVYDVDIFDFVEFLFYSGLRGNEALAMTIFKFDNPALGLWTAKDQKGKKTKILPIIEPLQFWINRKRPYINGRLFPRWKNLDGLKTAWNTMIEKFIEEGGEDIGVHRIRKTTSTYLISKGVPAIIVQKYLGHSDFNVTDEHYILVECEDIRREINNKATFNI